MISGLGGFLLHEIPHLLDVFHVYKFVTMFFTHSPLTALAVTAAIFGAVALGTAIYYRERN